MPRAALGEDTEIDAEFRAKDVNLADLRVDAPESRLDGVAHVQVTRTHRGTLTGRCDLTSWPGLIAGKPIPALDLEGTLDSDAAVAVMTNGRVHILEPGADTTMQYSIRLAPSSKGRSFLSRASPRLLSLAGCTPSRMVCVRKAQLKLVRATGPAMVIGVRRRTQGYTTCNSIRSVPHESTCSPKLRVGRSLPPGHFMCGRMTSKPPGKPFATSILLRTALSHEVVSWRILSATTTSNSI